MCRKPEQKGKADAWQTSISLQDVDRLKPLEFMLEQTESNNIVNKTFN